MPPAAPWSPSLRFGFRFIFCYWIFWALPENGRISLFTWIPIPWVSAALNYVFIEPYTKGAHAVIQWVGAHVFHLSDELLKYQLTGSGDTAKDWIAVFCYVVLSLAIACIWSILDRRRTEYSTLNRWLRIIVRYTLALTLLGYGGAKIVPLQFRAAGFYYLLLPYGQASPMGTLWRFMGSSLAYTVFAGLAETVSGLLLLFRRTTVIGCLSAAAVMLNVAILNYCYDVPVKLYSTNLLLMALFLLIPDIKRLADVLLLNRAVPALDLDRDRVTLPRLTPERSRVAVTVLKTVFLAAALGTWAYSTWDGYQSTYGRPTHPPLYGLYHVGSMTRAGVPIQADEPDLTRWQYIGFEYPGSMQCFRADGSRSNFRIQMDEAHSQFAIVTSGGGKTAAKELGKFRFLRTGPAALSLEGTWNGKTIGMQLDALSTAEYPLNKRGFHWVQEFPFNR
ncbi:MAG TPA: hypothetical protein VGL53_00540 [Bryobacteraceae bacterium]